MFEIFAPGKLFVFGEWSVLFGGRALVGSVDAGQIGRLTLAPCAETNPEFHYYTPEFDSGTRRWLWSDQGWREIDTPGDSGAIDVVGEVVRASVGRIQRPANDAVLHAASRGLFSSSGQKYGFGSSGAISALVSRALWLAAGVSASDEAIFELAMEGHRRAQGGRGSGADVAASVFGTCVVFELPDPPGFGRAPERARPAIVTPCTKPQGLSVLSVWSGQEADTRALMAAMAASSESDPEGWAERLGEVRSSAELGVEAWLSEDVGGVIEAAEASRAALSAMGEGADVPVVIESHEAIKRCVKEAGGEDAAVKPSGAGGGDMALAFVRDEVAEAVQSALEGEGYRWTAWM